LNAVVLRERIVEDKKGIFSPDKFLSLLTKILLSLHTLSIAKIPDIIFLPWPRQQLEKLEYLEALI
jgi:hypothetical protein